ncbi:MAG: hypothetical protein R2854_03950 [Caldilineaceae bacterium]
MAHAHATPAGFGDRHGRRCSTSSATVIVRAVARVAGRRAPLVLRWQAHYATAPRAAEARPTHLSAPWLRVEQTLGLVTQMAALVRTATPHWSHAPSADGN